MTRNHIHLQDALSKRIVQGKTKPQDLSLLAQLLRCQQRRWLILGVAAGSAITALFEAVAAYAF